MSNRNIREGESKNSEKYHIPGADDFRDEALMAAIRRDKLKRKKVDNHPVDDTMSRRVSAKSTSRNNTAGKGILFGILYGSGIVAITLIILMILENSKIEKNSGLPPIINSPFIEDTKEHFLKINLESCTLCLGQQIKLSASAYPADLLYSINWSSNDEDVAYVDDEGNVYVTGEGIAAITATSGDLVDAIAVEVVANKNVVTSLGLPFYSSIEGSSIGPVKPYEGPQYSYEDSQGSLIEQDDESGANQGSQQVQPGTQSSQPTTQSPQPTTQGQQPTTQSPQPTTQSPQPTTQGPQPTTQSPQPTTQSPQQPTQEPQPTTQPVVQPTTQAPKPIDVAEMMAVLNAAGLTSHLSNTYVYEKDDIYYGEVIIAEDRVHIYIKSRTTEFDAAIKGILNYLLPNSYERIWTMYLLANQDKTVKSEGRKVRFVMPAKDAHAQIIVYNP